MSSLFRVGISGGGTIGRVHAQALEQISNAHLVAVAEPQEAHGRDLASQHGAIWYRSVEEMLEQGELDVVIVATPSGLHPDQAVSAAQAGKHVITEKPMAITVDGIDRMMSTCAEANVQLEVIFQNRLSADVMKVRRVIEHGCLGRPVLANGAMYWYRSPEYYQANGGWRGTCNLDGGGALMNQAIHTVDLLQWLMDGVTSVQAHTTTLTHEIETEDVASASFRFNNGALGSITATTSASRDYPVRVEVIGTEGRVTLENNAVTLWEAAKPLDDSLLTDEDRELVDGWQPGEPFGAGHTHQLRTIFRRLADGVQAPVAGTSARKAVDIILGIYKSASTGTPINIER
jgi:UDP-N-acetyl-2-amino-2-deoxyglucuronate dehydrogenase